MKEKKFVGHEAAVTTKVISDWWNNLSENQHQTLIKKFFPGQMKKNDDANKFFNDLSWNTQSWLYEHLVRNYWDEYIKGGKNK